MSEIEQIVVQELEGVANDGTALLAIIGLERVLGRRTFRIGAGDLDKAAGLSRVLVRRFKGLLGEEGFKPIHLNLTDKTFFELRDLVVDGFGEARLAETLTAIADEDFKLVFGTAVNTALDYLKTRIPASPVRTKQTNPSEFLVAGFMRAWRTISNPMTVVDDLEMGCLSSDQIRILKTVYPGLYELFANTLMAVVVEKSANPNYEIEYKKLKQISVLLQQSLVPESLQGILAQSFTASDKPESAGKSSSVAPDLSRQVQTQSQKLEFQIK